ncbi:hypothetical protein DAPPUDRAFT_229962, partial [Daphnia pulex]
MKPFPQNVRWKTSIETDICTFGATSRREISPSRGPGEGAKNTSHYWLQRLQSSRNLDTPPISIWGGVFSFVPSTARKRGWQDQGLAVPRGRNRRIRRGRREPGKAKRSNGGRTRRRRNRRRRV